jgi:hypothetical protein
VLHVLSDDFRQYGVLTHTGAAKRSFHLAVKSRTFAAHLVLPLTRSILGVSPVELIMNQVTQRSFEPSRVAAWLIALVLVIVATVCLGFNGWKLGVPSTVLYGLAVLAILIDQFSTLRISPAGLEAQTRALADTARAVDQTTEAVDRLRIQVDATALANVFTQVAEMNRLVIDQPHLARLWKNFDDLDEDVIRQIFYLFVFLDAFEVLRQVSAGKPLSREYYNNWRRKWVPELLRSKAGTIMKDRGFLDYYSDETKDALGL